MDQMTAEEFKAALPIQLKNVIDDDVMALVNKNLSGPEATEIFKENLLSYSSVLMEGRFKMESYINAVRYVSFLTLSGVSRKAFDATFPEKVARWNAKGMVEKDQASYISRYHKSKLVMLLLAQTLPPIHILNAGVRQQAVNELVRLMTMADSEKVRCDASLGLLKELAPPETAKIELDLGIKQDSSIALLRDATQILIEEQKKLLLQGTSIKAITEGVLVVRD